MVNFDDWCYHAVAHIRFKPDRQMVFDELKAHLEDSSDHFLSQGYPEETAQRLAMEAMGDPEEIAPQLDKADALLQQSREHPEQANALLSQVCVISAYIKRRANLILLGEEKAEISDLDEF